MLFKRHKCFLYNYLLFSKFLDINEMIIFLIIIYNDDTCRTFIMRVNSNTFNINISQWEEECISKANEANENLKNAESGKRITVHEIIKK